jgi:hypothetical protein
MFEGGCHMGRCCTNPSFCTGSSDAIYTCRGPNYTCPVQPPIKTLESVVVGIYVYRSKNRQRNRGNSASGKKVEKPGMCQCLSQIPRVNN